MPDIKVTIDGVKAPKVAEGYSVVEDSTPLDPSDTTGGVGQFSVDFEDWDRAPNALGAVMDLEDGSQGTTRGTVRGASRSNDGTATLTADSRLGLLAVDRTAQPFVGTLEQWFEYVLGLVGVTSGYVVDDTIADRPVVFQGWAGNCWDEVKKVCTAEQIEIALVSDNIVLRALRGRVAENYRDTDVTENFDVSDLARSVEIYYYNNTPITDALVYPPGGWNEDVEVFVVGAGETVTYDIPLNASVSSIDQPVCVDSVDRYYEASSVYAVVGTGEGSDLPLPPAQWEDNGGSLTVAINEDTKSLTVTIVGSAETQYAPYRIAMTAGPSDNYSSLRIVGTGVAFDKKMLTLATSVDHDKVTKEVGATIDNPCITTEDQAYHCGLWALKRWGSPRHTITVTTSGINRKGDTGSYRYPTIAEFNALYAGMDIGDFNALWSGMTFADFNAYMRSLVAGDFSNQAFGNIAGARVRLNDAMFRIRNATIDEGQITYTAEEDTTVADVNAVWNGALLSDFNAVWADQTFKDFTLRPLYTGDYVAPSLTQPYPNTIYPDMAYPS